MKGRIEVYLSAETETALREYARRHRGRFPSVSRAAAHLLGHALMAGIDEGTEALLAPAVVQAVREATRREIQDGVNALLERQSHRLAALLVGSGKDAYRAAVTLAHFGLDTSGYSFGYVAHWAQEMTVFRRNLAAIQQTAQRLIVAIAGEGV